MEIFKTFFSYFLHLEDGNVQTFLNKENKKMIDR